MFWAWSYGSHSFASEHLYGRAATLLYNMFYEYARPVQSSSPLSGRFDAIHAVMDNINKNLFLNQTKAERLLVQRYFQSISLVSSDASSSQVSLAHDLVSTVCLRSSDSVSRITVCFARIGICINV